MTDRDTDAGDDGDPPPEIAALTPDRHRRHVGFFGPESVVWTISRERALQLNGPSTILLQLAHPKVAAGVADHSRFAEDPIGRFRRTFDLVHALVFGDVDAAIEAARRIRSTHAVVTGRLASDVGRHAAGDRYAASDPDLLLWVHATLIEQALSAYETYVAPVPPSVREAYYQESKDVGRLLGLPAGRYPETYADFTEYYDRTIRDELAVGTRSRALERALFRRAPVPAPACRFLSAGGLPAPIAAQFGLRWSRGRQRAFDAWAHLVRSTVPHLPAELRYVDAYRRAVDRLERAGTADGR